MAAGLATVFHVVAVVAALTQCPQVLVRTILHHFIHVCYGEDDVSHLARLLVEAVGVVFHSAKLASVLRPLQYPFSYLLPLLGVAAAVLCRGTPLQILLKL